MTRSRSNRFGLGWPALTGVTLIAMACSPHQGAVPVTIAPAQVQEKPASSGPAPAEPRASQPEKPAPVPATPSDVRPSDQNAEPPVASGPGWSIITTAPEGITSTDLGRVFDAAFQPLAGRGPLFKAKVPEGYPVFRHSASLVEDRITLAATVRSWGLNSDACRNRRFASYRAEQITEIHAVDDMTPPQAAPPAAMYYLAKVFYGRSFEVRLSGDEKQFHSGLAGTFLSGKFEGALKAFAEKNRLEFTALGRGLAPKSGSAIYAKQPSEIEENYTVDGSITVPVEVEYRLIPGRALPAVDPIQWRKLARYRVELSAVEAHHCDKTSACDLSIQVSQVDGNDKPKTFRGPDDVDLWEPRYQLLETTEEVDLLHGFNFEVSDRNLTTSTLLGRCQVRVDQHRIQSVNESPDRRKRWTELCGKAEIRLTLTAEDAN